MAPVSTYRATAHREGNWWVVEVDGIGVTQAFGLRADGLVESRRVGTTVYYRIARPHILLIIEALQRAYCPDPPVHNGASGPFEQFDGGSRVRRDRKL